MNTATSDDRQERCSRPGMSRLVTPYCFGEASLTLRLSFEEHLRTCRSCQEEVKRLSAGVSALRRDESVPGTLQLADVCSAIGISAKGDFPFSGYTRHVLLSAILYGLQFVLILLIETAYEFDQLGRNALIAAPFVFFANFGALLGMLRWISASGRRGLSRVTMAGFGLVFIALATLAVLSFSSVLPDHQVTRNHTTGWTAQIAYLKDLVYLLPVLLLFVLRPFQFIVTAQERLACGRHRALLPLLLGDRHSAGLRGVGMPSKRLLIFLSVAVAVFQFAGLMHLLDALEPGRFMRFFVLLLFVRLSCFFAFMGEAIHWYNSTLAELIQESAAVVNASRARWSAR